MRARGVTSSAQVDRALRDGTWRPVDAFERGTNLGKHDPIRLIWSAKPSSKPHSMVSLASRSPPGRAR
jgi:hypothetical protein